MKLKCEVCNGTNIVKENGVFVCQNCGIKYSLDEIKSLVSETNNSKTETNEEVVKLLLMARVALKNENYDEALSYYDKIYNINPIEWEAMLFKSYIKLNNTNVGDIPQNIKIFTNVINDVLSIIDKLTIDKDALDKLVIPSLMKSKNLIEKIADFVYYKMYSLGINESLCKIYYNVSFGTFCPSAQCLYKLGDFVNTHYPDYKQEIVNIWKTAVKVHVMSLVHIKQRDADMQIIDVYSEQIKKTEIVYFPPQVREYIRDANDLQYKNACIQLDGLIK